MKKLLLFLLFIFCILNAAFSQNPLVKQWDYRFGGTRSDILFSIQQTKDLGYILGGFSASGINGNKTQASWGYGDYWIIKIDSYGSYQWDKDFGGTNVDGLYSVQQTVDGGYILGGYSNSGISGNKMQNTWGGADYWIIKTDSLGNKQWEKDFGGVSGDALHSVRQTTDGGYILGGSSHSGISGDKTQANWDTTGNTSDYWIIKTDSLGNKQWDKDYGGTGADELFSLQQTTDGGYILGGYSNSDSSVDKTQSTWGVDDYWIVKTDSLGNKQWDKDFGGINYDYLFSLQQTDDGGYIFGGKSNSGISGDKTHATWGALDFWIIKADSLGNKQWDKDFGGTDNEDEFGNISQTPDGGYLISGTSYSNISGDKTENNLGQEQTWVIKTDSLCNKQWDKTLQTTGHDEQGLAIQISDGCFALANITIGGIGGDKTQPNWDTSESTYDYWIIKFCDSTMTTSITQLPNPKSPFSISPNPASESAVFSSRFAVKEIEIYNLFGEKVFHQQLTTADCRLTTADLPNGMYIIKAYTGKGVFQQKLVIAHP